MMPALEGFDHFTMVCRDLDRSIQFYTEVLGATVERPKRPSSSAGSPAGLSPVGIRIGNIGIDLFQAADDWQPYPGTYAQHYAFRIRWEDVDAWFAHLREKEIELFIHPAGDRTISLYLTDPTGYHIELNLRSDSPDFIREQCKRLIEKHGRVYHWTDGFGVPADQPQSQWATAPK